MSKGMTPLEAIRAKCLDCSGDSKGEVRLCTIETCPLFNFRMGKNESKAPRKMTDEHKQKLRERLKEARKQRGKINE